MERIGRRAGDPLLAAVQMLLLALGLAALFSASHFYAERVFQDPYHLVKRQLSFALIGLAACGLCARAPLALDRVLFFDGDGVGSVSDHVGEGAEHEVEVLL